MPRIKGILAKTVMLLAILMVCFLILEFTVRMVSPTVFHPDLKLIPYMNRQITINLSGVSPVLNHTTNKWGFRGDTIPPDIDDYYLILTIGGSTTQSFYIDDKKTWPYLIQENLREDGNEKVMVQNGGIDGHTSRGHLTMMQYVVPVVKPDMVIFLVGTNDMGLSLNREAFESGSRYENTPLVYDIFAQSRLLQILNSWYQVYFGGAIVLNAAHSNFVLVNMTRPEVNLSDGYEKELVSLPEYEENLKEIIRLGKEQGIRMLFLTQPTLFEDNEYWENIEGRNDWLDEDYYISAATFARMLDKFNQKLLEVCVEEKVECLDLASKVPHSTDYYYDAVHFNDKGSALVAGVVSDYLQGTVT